MMTYKYMINCRFGRILDKLQLLNKLKQYLLFESLCSDTCSNKLFILFLLRPKFMKEMSNRSELLKKLTNISEECSDIESDITNFELSSEDEVDYIQSETSDTEESDEESITNDENESVINMPRKRCRVLSSPIVNASQ
jgi:hypothetical protein